MLTHHAIAGALGPILVDVRTTSHAAAQPAKWVTTWAASVHGPYPVGNPSAQPNQRFAFPVPADGARDQTFRLIVRPDVGGPEARLRFSNGFGTRPLELDDVHVGVQLSGAAIARGTNRPVTFNGQSRVVIPAGRDLWSDAVALGAPAEIGRASCRERV